MSRILILGGGFAGAYCAQALERMLRGFEAEVVLLDRNNYFVFYPLLAEAGTGSLEPRHVVVSLRSFLNTTVLRMAEVREVDLERREVTYRLEGGREDARIHYNYLILALGSVTRLPDVPGLDQYGFEMKTLSDAVTLRDRAIRMLELADALADPHTRRALLHFVVVGGNFTGVEVAGEFDMFLREASRQYRNIREEDCRVTLVEIAERILPALDADLADYAARQMRRRGMVLLMNQSVSRIESDHIELSTGETLPTHTVIWCAGIQPNPLIGKIALPTDDRGYILCDEDLGVRGFENIWAIGDCAVNLDPEGNAYPATAQHAVRQGRHLARNLRAMMEGSPVQPFVYASLGSLAAIGCRTGVARILGLKLSGFPAYFLWRTVYWLKMPGLPRKARLALDWTAGLLFARDMVQLGVHRHRDTTGQPHP